MVFQERTYSVLIVTALDSFINSVMPLLPRDRLLAGYCGKERC